MIWLLLACGTSESEPAKLTVPSEVIPASDADLVPLPAPRLLRRMSLDLRGILPSVEELDAVEADPAKLESYRDAYLEDPRFEERLVMLLGERWGTRADEFLIQYSEYQALASDPHNAYLFQRAVGEEPLRLMAHVVAQDQPWSQIVTADYTMANETLGSIWPIERTSGSGWVEGHYTDGRPAAGILATNGLWWRYYTTISNYNRGRAAALSRLLLCEDYLARPVSFTNSVALVDKDGIEEALRSNPYCMGCHSSLDPTASTLFGFWVANEYNAREMDHYHPEREPLGQALIGVEPGWFGTPVSGLSQLGQDIAADPRFSRCAAESMAELYWRRELQAADFERIEGLRESYLDSGEQMKALIRTITDTPVYRAGSLAETTEDTENTTRMIDATLLRSLVQEMFGYLWTWEGYDVLDEDVYGYRILGGGVDGSMVSRPQRTPSLTWGLVVQRVGEAAGYHMADTLGRPDSLFHYASQGTQPGSSAFDQEISELYWHLNGERPDENWKTAVGQLWSGVNQREGDRVAWTALISSMIRDPLFVSY